MSMFPLLAVALLVWAGIFVFLLVVERKVMGLERKLDDLRARNGNVNVGGEEVRR